MNYIIDIMPDVLNGAKAKRLGWPEDKYIQGVDPKHVQIKIEGISQVVVPAQCIVMHHPKKQVKDIGWVGGHTLGYEFTSEDKICQDWVITEEKKPETPAASE